MTYTERSGLVIFAISALALILDGITTCMVIMGVIGVFFFLFGGALERWSKR